MMNPAHMLEIALLLLVAFLSGAIIGSLARLAVARLMPTKAPGASPVAADSAVADQPRPEELPALVAAPVIGEVAKTPTPTAPAEIPALDFTEALLALAGDKPGSVATRIKMPSMAPLPVVAVTKPAAEMQPARVAGETTSGRVVAHPRSAAASARVISLEGGSAEVIPFPLEKVAVESPEPAVVVVATPMPAVEPALSTVAAEEPPRAEPEATAEPAAELALPVEAEEQPAAAVVEAETSTTVEVLATGPEVVANVVAVELPGEELPGPVAGGGQTDAPLRQEQLAAVASEPTGAPEQDVEDDEAAAMRAIEGNWSPRRAASPRPRKVDLPEVSAEAAIIASAAAVASATAAASLATAPEPEAPGRPSGIPAPRLGVKDDLTHVIGILPIIETALNNLGLYHFDQVAELSDDNAGWIENHLGIAGRIRREHWREQARELALATSGTKRAAGQQ